MGWRFFKVKVTRFIFYAASIYLILSCWSHQTPTLTLANPQDWSNLGKTETDDFWNKHFHDFKVKDSSETKFWPFDTDNIHRGSRDEEDIREKTKMATKVIAGIIIFVVLASFIAFLICLCCPICILAKMRQRRRGFVYQTTANGASTTVQAGRTTVVVTNARQVQGSQQATPLPSVVAVPTVSSNSPYPVQQSVTVMPASAINGHPQQHHPQQYGYPNQPMPPYPMNAPSYTDLPPPYPHQEMNAMQNSSSPDNLPYNPYFRGDEEAASAPNPYNPTTAPYPTKQ